jgi:hypothetical protein
MYPDDRVLVAMMNSPADWERVQAEGWYRLPVNHAPPVVPHIDWLAFYFGRNFADNKWAIHHYARVTGHELLTRRQLIPAEPTHPRAEQWYYKFSLGPIQFRLPPIVSDKWRLFTFILTTGDRFEAAGEVGDLLRDVSAGGQPFVVLKETEMACRFSYRPEGDD